MSIVVHTHFMMDALVENPLHSGCHVRSISRRMSEPFRDHFTIRTELSESPPPRQRPECEGREGGAMASEAPDGEGGGTGIALAVAITIQPGPGPCIHVIYGAIQLPVAMLTLITMP